MPVESLEGVVLKMEGRGEADEIITFLTPTLGPFHAVAKQAKWSVRRFGGRLMLLNRLEFGYSRKSPEAPAFLDETELIERYSNILKDPIQFGFAMALAELLMGAWGSGEPAQDVYRFFIAYLRMAGRGAMGEDTRLLMSFRLLELLGHRPSFEMCASCGNALEKKARQNYSVLEGGAVCDKCAPEIEQRDSRTALPLIRVRNDTLKTVEAGLAMSADRLGRLKFSAHGRAEAYKIWAAHASAILGRVPHSVEYLDKIIS